jgi:hypothetical protein
VELRSPKPQQRAAARKLASDCPFRIGGLQSELASGIVKLQSTSLPRDPMGICPRPFAGLFVMHTVDCLDDYSRLKRRETVDVASPLGPSQRMRMQ